MATNNEYQLNKIKIRYPDFNTESNYCYDNPIHLGKK